MNKKFLVITKTPLRISFFGGGTDFKDFYKVDYGRVVATAINKFIYVTVKNHEPLFNENYRLNYSETEKINSLSKIKNNIIRECLRLVKIKPPIYISIVSDVPSHTGLGSSSSLIVGLLNALYVTKGIFKTPNELAQLACRIEINILKQPIGKQDHYVSAYGGFAEFKFLKNNKVKVKKIKNNILTKIFRSSVIVWTGQYREAKLILKDQKKRIKENFFRLKLLNQISNKFLYLTKKKKFNLKKFAYLLDKSWYIKKKLSKKISSEYNNKLYEKFKQNGVIGGKILGAGGGGFFFFIYDQLNKKKLTKFLKKFYTIKCLPYQKGTEVIYKDLQFK